MPLILYFLVSKNINDWMDHQRISDEVESILITVVKDQEEVSRLQSLNDEDQENVDSLKDEMTDSQAIYENHIKQSSKEHKLHVMGVSS